MIDPCIACDGHSYDRKNISKWLADHDTSPATGLPLTSKALIPNIALRNAIDDWEDGLHANGGSPDTMARSTRSLPSSSQQQSQTAGPNDAPAVLSPGAVVMYVNSKGEEEEALVLVVHPGGAEDPEPYYTVRLEGGAERETVRSRLRPALKHDAAAAEEEAARREAVERSRREARQERRRRSQEAAASAERMSRSRSWQGGASRMPRDSSATEPNDFDSVLRAAGEAIGGAGDRIAGAFREWGQAFQNATSPG